MIINWSMIIIDACNPASKKKRVFQLKFLMYRKESYESHLFFLFNFAFSQTYLRHGLGGSGTPTSKFYAGCPFNPVQSTWRNNYDVLLSLL